MQYDYIILTHLPSFYKVNLYNELAKQLKILVVFLGHSSTIRTPDFMSHDFQFEAIYLSEGSFELRSKWRTCLKCLFLLKKVSFKKILVGGWEHPEFWLSVWTTRRAQNVLCLESGFESVTQGIKAFIKKLFLSRIGTVLATGEAQIKLARMLKFSRPVLKTSGVGIFNYQKFLTPKKPFTGQFLFVGRLSKEKNIEMLCQAFAALPDYQLTIVGQGPDMPSPTKNVRLLGHMQQSHMARIYAEHDVLILPSLQEPWGLVVEEALFHGLPVIVSNKVGAKELVERYQAGLIFEATSIEALKACIESVSEPRMFSKLTKNIKNHWAERRDEAQVNTYQQLIA